MNLVNTAFYKTSVTLRITALWAFSEAFMGGILHGFKLPFAGLILSFVASVCITLIALGNNKKGEIIKATLLVIAIKFILSPLTPPMAYLAVFIQGAVGELLFINRRFLKTSAFTLTLFSLLYSAFQQLLTLTIIFGKGFWQAMDIFLNKITQSFSTNAIHYSLYLVLFYVACYLAAGIIGGFLNIKIIANVQSGNQTHTLLEQLNNIQLSESTDIANTKSAKRKKGFTIIFGCLMVLMLLFSYLPFFSKSFGKSQIPELIIRGTIIILVWNYFITPLLRLQIEKWVHQYKERNSGILQQVIALLPGIKIIVQQSWQLSAQTKKWNRFKLFINNTVLLIVHHE